VWRYAALWAAVFALVMLFMLGYLPIPLAVPSWAADAYKPVAYTAPGDGFDAVVASPRWCGGSLVIVYWFHWGYDGYEQRDDWEPVLVAVDGGSVRVAARVHWRWRFAGQPVFENGTHPVVVFGYLWHTPLFTYPPTGYVRVGYEPVVAPDPQPVDPCAVVGMDTGVVLQDALAASVVATCATVIYWAARETV